ncbi:MotA/TolQ/ExbB proton channel family protein [Photobacterium sp. CCB-ST2H9]|uniref:MotA/TolQ/ExbB proton channel family protein n=1 Tax=unclassified Photobacterium TaxID=2628852 RepID=UPI002002DE97|nr:MotA/TolQ/ExbB proton channel family protein [Photobacterium sp. CCB-ST2H9]UTM56092.1 MotA/TolQ/ExbB proton channel family protein [Photobacterium sp. CCB-ST2H9]
MLTSIFEFYLKGVNASSITDFFLVTLVFIFCLSLLWKKSDKHHAFTNYTPTLLTSLGILGTFTGIISGLLDFDTSDIDNSVGPLLEGLKTAFITSLAGMLLSIIYKVFISSGVLSKVEDGGTIEEDIDIVDLYKVMNQQLDGISLLRKSISENDEASLVGQIKLTRSDINENYKNNGIFLDLITKNTTELLSISKSQQNTFNEFEKELWLKLQEFADMMSKSATEQVIDALKQVIQDFNSKLTEQFGKNFSDLNEAVKELVIWQENYKNQLNDMKLQYDLGVLAIAKTEESVSNISREAQNIPETMSVLKQIMEVNQHQIQELDSHLNAFKDVRDKAVEAVPEIRGQIELAISGAREASDKLAVGIVESSEHIKAVISEGAENYRDTVDRTRAALTESAQATANSSEEIKERFAKTLEDINSQMHSLILEIQQGSKTLNSNYREASEQIIQDTEKVRISFSDSMEQMKNSLSSTIEEQALEHRKQADRIFAGLEKTIEEALSNTGESVQKQVNMIDQTMGEEIEKVLQSMGTALTSISGRFTEDYSRLVKKMSDIVAQQA